MIFAGSFPQIEITQQMKDKALDEAKKRYTGKKLIGSHEKWEEDGLENLRIGNLGEIAFANYFNAVPDFAVFFGKDQFDFLLSGKKINVKTSKSFFKGYESFLINKNEINSQCDYFAIVQITQDESKAVLFGLLPKAKLYKYKPVSDKLHYPAFKISFEKLDDFKILLS